MVLRTWKRWFIPLIAIAALPAQGGSQSRIPAGSKTAHYVKAEARTGTMDERGIQPITVTLNISPKVSLYGRSVPRDFDTLRLNVDVFEKDTQVRADMTYPPGTVKEYGGAKFEFYSGKIVITGTLRRAVGRDVPIEVRIRMLGNRGDSAP